MEIHFYRIHTPSEELVYLSFVLRWPLKHDFIYECVPSYSCCPFLYLRIGQLFDPIFECLLQISAYFKINSLETPVGLIKRSSQNNGSKQKPYELIENQCMLSNGELYFLYFREANPGESILGSSPAIKTHKTKNVSISSPLHLESLIDTIDGYNSV